MKAAALTVGLGTGLVLVVILCGWFLGQHLNAAVSERSLFSGPIHRPAWAPTTLELEQGLRVAVFGTVLLLITTVLVLSAGHFRRVQPSPRSLALQWACLGIGLAATMLTVGSGLIRMAALHHQAGMADVQAERREELNRELVRGVADGTLPQTLRERFGVPSGATAEELGRAIHDQGGPQAVEEILVVLRWRRTGTKNNRFLNDMAARYGLPVLATPTNLPGPPQSRGRDNPR